MVQGLVRYPGAGCVVEFMQGNAPQIAWVLEEQNGRLRLLLPNRRETALQAARILPWPGPAYEKNCSRDAALEILKQKRKGGYNIVAIDADYVPAPVETKEVFGVTFEQGRNEVEINAEMLSNIVTQRKDLPEEAKRDLLITLITLKYTQSNSVCYAEGGQTIGVGAGQQSRIHCTRLAGNKADIWHLRAHPKVLSLQFADGLSRPDKDNAIDVYISEDYDDVLADGVWQRIFRVRPDVLTAEEKREYLSGINGVSLGSDAFFPFSDNIQRAYKSGVRYIAETGGSVRDDLVIAEADRLGITMAFTGCRLFHH